MFDTATLSNKVTKPENIRETNNRFYTSVLFRTFPYLTLNPSHVALCHMTKSANRSRNEKHGGRFSFSNQLSTEFILLFGVEGFLFFASLSIVMKKFSINTIDNKMDFKAIRDESYELFTHGYIHVNKILVNR